MKTKRSTRIPATVSFRISPEDYAIIAAGQEKHGLRKASDVLRMALRRFAEAEGLKKAS